MKGRREHADICYLNPGHNKVSFAYHEISSFLCTDTRAWKTIISEFCLLPNHRNIFSIKYLIFLMEKANWPEEWDSIISFNIQYIEMYRLRVWIYHTIYHIHMNAHIVYSVARTTRIKSHIDQMLHDNFVVMIWQWTIDFFF